MIYCLNPNCQKPQNPPATEFCQTCGAKLRLRERYCAIKPIGQGGFGKTYLAVDEGKPSKPACVIKQFHPQSQETDNFEKAAELFSQEAVRLDELGVHPQNTSSTALMKTGTVIGTDDEGPQHQVNITPFFMGKYPITQEQYEAVMGQNPSKFKGEKQPVELVSWHDANEFCNRLSQKTGRKYRLPSEAEWEYACRAGTATPFYFGETIATDVVNYDGKYTYGSAPKGIDRQQTTDVGSFPPNNFGLYDLHGNVSEWCADIGHKNYKQAPSDGSIWESKGDDKYRMIRGGSWDDSPWYCRSAARVRGGPDIKREYVGFRVVLSRSPTD